MPWVYSRGIYTDKIRRIIDVSDVPGDKRFDLVVVFSSRINKIAAKLVRLRVRQMELF